jgi:hypothetical protein
MSEGTIGLILLSAISIGSAFAWHWLVKFYFLAVLGATVTTVFAFQVANYLYLGYLDPFFLIAIVTTSIPAVAVALVVGIPFRAQRNDKSV